MHNLDIKTDLKKTVKKFLASVSAKNKSEAETGLKTVFKKIDKAAKRNILHKNTAARRKSRFSTLVAKISG
jgi:small subunit ribosomal protein S20